MGANAATKAYKVLQNTENILAIELLHAMQALDLRGLNGVASTVQALHKEYRKNVAFANEDVEMHQFIKASLKFTRECNIDAFIADE